MIDPMQKTVTVTRDNSVMKIVSTLLLPALLMACEGPVTEQNVNAGGGGGSVNNSPPAATEDVRAFEVNVWSSLKADNRCGQCHGNGGQDPTFADASDVNIAYSYAVPLVDLQDPVNSLLVTKVASGHQCWEQFDSVCADVIESMVANWAGVNGTAVSARSIQMVPPAIKNPGDSKNFPATATDNTPNSFAETVHVLLKQRCIDCHYEEGVIQQQSPFFANPDASAAYEAAKPKMNIDLPVDSRVVQRLLDGHNCWSDCGSVDANTGAVSGNAGEMLAEIQKFAGAISTTAIDPALITSKALVLLDDGIVASGGNRHEANLIAIWEFKAGSGFKAFDTSGIEPFMHLNLDGNVNWLGAYGLDLAGGKAWADTTTSKKMHDFIQSSGEYSIEAWVVPANVTQEDANIISLDAGSIQKNFALTQTLYNYNFHNRTDVSDTNGIPVLSTEDAGEILQSSLQHVVATYDPVNGRQIFVNGELINVPDPVAGSTSIGSWDDTFAFVLGNSSANSRPWSGKLRLVAMHNRVLTPEQVTQNFEAGVGQKYFLLFSIADQIGIPESYIRFEVSQFDSYSYLFDKPTFINLDANWTPGGFSIQKMRIGINGKQAVAGQSYAYMDATIDSSYNPVDGQLLSPKGAVIALEKGADSDEFFLTFEFLAGSSNAFNDPMPTPPPPPADAPAVSDIGVRTFDEINESIARLTGIPVTNPAVDALYQQYKQQLPTVETIDAFLSSHQMAIAQLALTSCSERVELDRNLAPANRVMFTNVDFTESAQTAFDTPAKRSAVIDPVLTAVLGQGLDSQPDQLEISDALGASTAQTLDSGVTTYSYNSLIDEMVVCPVQGVDPHYNPDFPCDLNTDIYTAERTAQIAKAVCAAAVGSAAMLIQ